MGDSELGLESDKLKSILKAHLDGIYVFSARKNCDDLVTALILAYQHRIRKQGDLPPTIDIEAVIGEIEQQMTEEFSRLHVRMGQGNDRYWHVKNPEDFTKVAIAILRKAQTERKDV